MRNDFHTTSICGDCAKSVGFCSWSSRLIPVKGWNARPVERRLCGGGKAIGYAVTECPLFELDERTIELCRNNDARNSVWTSEDKEVVFQNYGHIPTSELANMLGRTVSAIHKMVSNERKKTLRIHKGI